MSTITDKVFYAEISMQIHDGRLLALFPAPKFSIQFLAHREELYILNEVRH